MLGSERGAPGRPPSGLGVAPSELSSDPASLSGNAMEAASFECAETGPAGARVLGGAPLAGPAALAAGVGWQAKTTAAIAKK